MSDGTGGGSSANRYRRLMLQKAVELSQKHGGLKKIPADVLLENGIELCGEKATKVSIKIPSEKIMEKRIVEMEAQAQPQAIAAKEVEQFKLPSEPIPRAISKRQATMEDFWIEQGWYKIDKNGWRLTRAKWIEGDAVRRKAVRFLVEEVLRKDPKKVNQEDFNSNLLAGLFSNYYSASPYEAISEAFPELGIKPWEMSITPNKFFLEKKNRVAAVKWLVEKLGKDPRDLEKKDFEKNGLVGLIHHYSNSPFIAVSEAFPEEEIKPWEKSNTPIGYYEKKENRVAAVRWLVEKLGKDSREITADDFRENKLGGLFMEYYSNSPYEAVSEAFPELKIQPWEMLITPSDYFDNLENRTKAVRWLVKKVGKDPRDLQQGDFGANGLFGLIYHRYSGSPYKAVAEAFPELKIHPWEMAVTPMGFYKNKKNRVAAVRWLVEKLGKDPKDVTQMDFHSNRLGGLLQTHSGSPYEALLEAGFVTEKDERYMRTRNR